jgi:2-polyprenyl-3-methyl-5-hydroxy-6-metoxy-1,4-benzoquinol methylase
MGNSRWIVRGLRQAGFAAGTVAELGAGEGRLAARIAKAFPEAAVTGLDLVSRPKGLDPRIGWECGDFFETLEALRPDAVVASLVLHHFSDAALRELGGWIRQAKVVVFSEPWRAPLPLRLSALAMPFVGRVTRHDMPASIRAGFRPCELPRWLGLDAAPWRVEESCRWQGALRVLGWRP